MSLGKRWRGLRHQIRVTILSTVAATVVLGLVLVLTGFMLRNSAAETALHKTHVVIAQGLIRDKDRTMDEILDRNNQRVERQRSQAHTFLVIHRVGAAVLRIDHPELTGAAVLPTVLREPIHQVACLDQSAQFPGQHRLPLEPPVDPLPQRTPVIPHFNPDPRRTSRCIRWMASLSQQP